MANNINDNLSNLMKEAQKMQKRMEEAQQKLTDLTVEGQSGGGMVKIKMNGRHDVLECKIKPSLVADEDVEMLEDLVTAAVNDAVHKIEKLSKDEIGKLTSGLQVPKDFMKAGDKD